MAIEIIKQLGRNCMKLSVNFTASENDDEDDVQAADDKAEPVMKKPRLESDFEQLSGPHFEGRKKDGHSTPAKERCDYCATPHIPMMDNPLQWWDRKS